MKVDKCSSCPAHCCVAFRVGAYDDPKDSIEWFKKTVQRTDISLTQRKDALKVLRWTRYRKTITPDGKEHMTLTCSKLIDGRCSVYAIRPNFCRLYTCENDGKPLNSIEGVKYEEIQYQH